MRIALVSEFFYPTLGGIQEHLFNCAREYTERGHEVSIVTPHVFTKIPFDDWWPKSLPKRVYRPFGYSLPFFINGSVGRTTVGFFLGREARKLFSPENFDIVHLHAPLNGTLPILANHFATVPVVGTFHTSFPNSLNLQIFKIPAQRHVERLSRVIAVSPISLHSINKFLEVDGEIVPNGIATKAFKPLWEVPDDRIKELCDGRINILFIGRPEPRNGLDTLIRAFIKVYAANPKTRLIIAGGGNQMPKYKTMTKGLPEGAVHYTGPVLEERPSLYRTADIHVFGVEKATFSITVLEGMASGLPVVTTNFEGHRSLGVPGEHFLTTPFGDDEALAQELIALASDPARRSTLGHAARAHSLSFDWSIIAEKVLAIYEQVLTSDRT